MIDVNKIVLSFQNFLESCFEIVEKNIESSSDDTEQEEILNDFLQANWELLVESIICESGKEFLAVYGDGADCNGASSRVCFPQKIATHKIECMGNSDMIIDRLSGKKIKPQEYAFHSFISYSDDGYFQGLPFNGVLLEGNNDIAVVDISDIYFQKSRVLESV